METPQLFRISKPLWRFSRICGLLPADGAQNKIVACFWKFYSLLVFVSNVYLLVTYPSLDLTTGSNHIVLLTDSLCSVINNATLPICIGCNYLRRDDIKWLNGKFVKMEAFLGKTFAYSSVKNLLLIVLYSTVFSWLATIFALKLVYMQWHFCLYDWFEFYFASCISDVQTIQFLFFVYLLKLHLSAIRGRLRDLKYDASIDKKVKFDTILVLKRYHRKLFKVFERIDRVFSVPLLFTIANIFIAMFAELYFSTNGRALYNRAIFKPGVFGDFLITISVFLKLTFKLLIVTRTCENVYSEQRDICWVLHGITVDRDDAILNRKISEFSLQLIHEKITFTAAGFFVIDNSLLRTVISAVTIYLVILIQFDMTTMVKV